MIKVAKITKMKDQTCFCDICQSSLRRPMAAMFVAETGETLSVCVECWKEIWEAVKRRQNGND